VKIERIVSMGPAVSRASGTISPGRGRIGGPLFEGEAKARVLSPGGYVLIPARLKHRVEWTSQDHATIWLAVHYPETK
jgi:hypothetical protein